MVILYLILLCIFLSYDLFITNMCVCVYIYIYQQLLMVSNGWWLVVIKMGSGVFFLKKKSNVNVFSKNKKIINDF